ncbi:uncharacterized protein LOC129218823 [Uloborus diversus]|uniref:uncharacterized protein LOC129218823 n=1 Tax=Uloborus diversus TaxID=327109 RepID=UPI002408F34F|nr:uncharacterized protein LOC129218823 [Uloborus diversus]
MDLKALKKRKTAVKASLTKLREKINSSIDCADATELEFFKIKIQKSSEDITSVFNNIFDLSEESELDSYITELQSQCDIIDELLLVVCRAISKNSSVVVKNENPDTRGWWERSIEGDSIPKLDELLEFLKSHSRTLQTSKQQGNKKLNVHQKVSTFTSEIHSLSVYCKAKHSLIKCNKFLNLSVQDRVTFVKKNNVCFNCLLSNHRVSQCKSVYKCKKCAKNHHTLLHYNQSENNSEVNYQGASNSNTLSASAKVLLCTAIIKVVDSSGELQLCRALLDPGSQASFIPEDCLQRLILSRKKAKFLISCLGSSDAKTNGISKIKFVPHFTNKLSFTTPVFVINKIIGELPHITLSKEFVEQFSDLTLADPTFFKNGPIDILLGVDISMPMFRGETIQGGENMPYASRSDLGWIISGSVNFPATGNHTIQVNNIQLETQEMLTNFWKLDSVPEISSLTKLEQDCENHFLSTFSRDNNGIYTVKLPFHSSPELLGESRQVAVCRFKSLEKSLSSKPEVHEQYKNFISEYYSLGHMEMVPNNEVFSDSSYYLPHHGVVKESSSTTKLRVVFDASAKSTSGLSLNDLLMTGPRIQQELFPILLRFRTLVTVTYGTASAPFLSTRVMKQLALDEKDNFPLATDVAIRDFYVDDLLSGAQSEETAKLVAKQMFEMMLKGGFTLRKWLSNVPNVLEGIPERFRENNTSVEINCDTRVKVLGIQWQPSTDTFHFTDSIDIEKPCTKRNILSEIAKIFDPM